MKKILVLAILLLAGVAFAQQTQTQNTQDKPKNLGELSKKERERREALAKEKKQGKVYTASDIDRVKDKLGMETTAATDNSTEPSAEPSADQPAGDQATDQTAQDSNASTDDQKKEAENE